MKPRSQSGSAPIEFSLCAVFIIFLLISLVDMSRGLWINHTLAEAVRGGTRWAIVKGSRYSNLDTGERLPGATLADVRAFVLRSAPGLVPSQLNLRFESAQGVINCSPSTECPGGTLGTNWPPDGYADPGREIGIFATYPYNSLAVMYFPGGGGLRFGQYVLQSVSRERIVF